MLILFDLDGTLIDSQRGIFACIAHALNGMGEPVPPESQLRSWIGPPLRVSFPQVLGDAPERTEEAVRRYREHFQQCGWHQHEVYPGIAETVTALHGDGHTLAVVTAKTQDEAERIIAHLPFGACFSRVDGTHPDSADHGKAEKIALAMQALDSTAEDTLMVGDRRYDMEGAVANQVRAVGVSWGFGSTEELRLAGASQVIDQAHTLRQLVDMTDVA
ncbi:HAD hydrolase-like protein [Oleiagrimonas sp. C23AA]|uniref:HAD hydrolase-like protein n=1 Tax=Oleiagrimonas sp. C23AA TaxID=2719047 RepID=UPI00141DBC0E|nr:HAD hydrolase-like protein [Oleiagrimonas sp. C23AA]NII12373.1 HAD hydrolase-like protein [Oleiagrimonas sp. C23AA]